MRMQTLVNGIIKTKDGFAVKNFTDPDTVIEIGTLSFDNYPQAVHYLANLLYPESYRSYLLAVEKITPNRDTWNNLIFLGTSKGLYDYEQKCYKSARQLDMSAASEVEVAYVEALHSTYESIQAMIQ